MKEAEYKWVGDHPQEITGGRVLEPGEAVTLDEEAVRDPHNEALITSGGLIPVNDPAEHEASLAKRREAARTRQGQGEEE